VISSGLTIVFGVTRIVNFAHGSFYMLGAYLGVTILPELYGVDRSFLMFVLGALLSALAVGVIGVLIETVLLRRIYKAPELFQLLATFGVVLMIQDIVLKIWGPLDIPGPRVPGLRHAVDIIGQRFPAYELFLIAVGPLVLGLLWLLMHRTRFGVLIRAATQDREMVGALGVNQALLFTGTLFLGAFLAGFGGVLQIPRVPASTGMDLSVITDTFVVTVIGGMGSVPGAFLAALIIGQLQAFGILIFPKVTLVLVFLLMAVVLVFKPWGLLGKPDGSAGRAVLPDGVLNLKRFGPAARFAAAVALLAILALPLIGDAYKLKVGIEVLVFALAAFSLNFLAGIGGIISFGHAAYFGIGAYAAGLFVKQLGLPMEPALLAAPFAGAAFAALFGYFVVRLSGIYLAMLTLAFAQIVYAVCFQWVEVTGGDNGIVGVWPSAWASSRLVYFYLVAAIALAAILLLRRIIYAPFGYTLRAARDSATRADAIGIDVRTHRWLGFTLSGAAAGLAGGLYAFSKGSIDPTMISISMSIDFLVMVLVGGIQTVMGPLVGAAVFHSVKDFFMPLTDAWRFCLGLSIIVMVLVFPSGLSGAGEALRGWRDRRAAAIAPEAAA
jgi:branched-chain amino acid transport system permease protein